MAASAKPILKAGALSPGFTFLQNIQNDPCVCSHIVSDTIIGCLYDGAETDLSRDGRLYYGSQPIVFRGITRDNLGRVVSVLDRVLHDFNDDDSSIEFVKCEGTRVTCVMSECVIRFITTGSYDENIKLFTDPDTHPDYIEEFILHGKIDDICGILVSRKVVPIRESLGVLLPEFADKTDEIRTHVLRALGWIHEQGFVHTDATLDNVGWDATRGQFVLYDIHDSRPLVPSTRDDAIAHDFAKLYGSLGRL